jgi:hypothetical protein
MILLGGFPFPFGSYSGLLARTTSRRWRTSEEKSSSRAILDGAYVIFHFPDVFLDSVR